MQPQYLKAVDTLSEIAIGKRVKFFDGSCTLQCFKTGLRNTSPSCPPNPIKGIVLATDCILPTDNTYSKNIVNNTVVMTDEGNVIFCYDKFLRVL